MALSKSGLKSRITTEMEAQGITTTGTYAFSAKLAEAIANAVIDEITANAKCSGVHDDGVDDASNRHNNVQIV